MTDPVKNINNLPGLLVYRIGAEEFCIDIKEVQSIIKVAGTDYYYGGDLRGHYAYIKYSDLDYMLFDSSKIFTTVADKVETGKKIILCTLFSKRVGLIVDDIVEFISLDYLFIQKNIDMTEGSREFVKWKLNYHTRIIYYPDYEKITREFSSAGVFQNTLNSI